MAYSLDDQTRERMLENAENIMEALRPFSKFALLMGGVPLAPNEDFVVAGSEESMFKITAIDIEYAKRVFDRVFPSEVDCTPVEFVFNPGDFFGMDHDYLYIEQSGQDEHGRNAVLVQNSWGQSYILTHTKFLWEICVETGFCGKLRFPRDDVADGQS